MRTVLQVEYVGDLAPYDFEREQLARVGAELVVVRGTGSEVVDAAGDAQVIWLEWTPHFTREVLTQLPGCGLVLRWGVGYDQIDVAAATELGIAVGNAPSYCTLDVAEHALALMLSVSRQITVRQEQMRAGLWRAGAPGHRRLAGSTVGIVGLGRIGRRTAELCGALGATVLGHDPVVGDLPGIRSVALETLLSHADYVSVHVPLTDDTHRLIRAETLALMRPQAVLINTSRGGAVDQDDLIAALTAGRLRAAALDVFEDEPLAADHALRGLPNVVLTPHDGSYSPESLADLRREICDATTEWLSTGWARSVVNPEVRDRPRVSGSGA